MFGKVKAVKTLIATVHIKGYTIKKYRRIENGRKYTTVNVYRNQELVRSFENENSAREWLRRAKDIERAAKNPQLYAVGLFAKEAPKIPGRTARQIVWIGRHTPTAYTYRWGRRLLKRKGKR